MLLLVDNKSNIVCLSISIFKKPNVNGTLERTKSAQNKIEEKKTEKIITAATTRVREKKVVGKNG